MHSDKPKVSKSAAAVDVTKAHTKYPLKHLVLDEKTGICEFCGRFAGQVGPICFVDLAQLWSTIGNLDAQQRSMSPKDPSTDVEFRRISDMLTKIQVLHRSLREFGYNP